MKKFLWGLGIVVVVLIGAVLIAPSFIDWNQYKDEIAAQAREHTGRELIIGGDIRATILPAPALIAETVRLGNIEGATSPDMVSLDRLEVRIAFAPLLTGEVRVETVRLINPVVELERTQDGRTNWTFQPPADSGGADGGAEGGDGGGPSIAVQSFRVEDGVLIYRDAQAGTTQRIEDIDADFAAATLQGPFETTGALTYRDTRLGFELNVGEMIQGRTIPLGMRLDFGGGAMVANVAGTVLGLEEDAPRFKADVKVEGPDAARVARALDAAGDDLPGYLAQPFSLQTALTANAEEVAAGNLILSLGDVRARGDARASLGDIPEVRLNLMAETIDVDELLATSVPAAGKKPESDAPSAGTEGTPQPQPESDGQPDGGAGGFTLPKDVAGSVSLRVDALQVRGGVVRNAVVNAELSQGEITLSQLSAQLPGGSDVAVFGFLSSKDGAPRFEGNIEAKANDLRAVLDWAGVSLDAVPSDRLRQLTLAADLRTTVQQTKVEKLRLQFDNTTVTGGAVIAHRARPSFGVGLAVDHINVDAYLKDDTAAAAGGGDAEQADGRKAGDAAGGQQGGKPRNPFSALNALTAFDANLRLHVKEFVYGGRPGKDLFAEGEVHSGALDLKRLSVGSYAGVAGQITGRLVNLGGVPSAENLKLDVSGKSVGGLFDALGIEPPLPPASLGPTRLQAELDGNLLQPDLNASLETLGGRFGASGKVNVLPVGKRFDLTLSARHNDPATLFRMASKGAYRPTGPLGPLDLTATVSGNETKADISALQGKIGKLDVRGTGSVAFGGERPRVVADLTAGELVIEPFLPAERRASLGGGRVIPAVAKPHEAGEGRIVRIATQGGERWSDEAIDLSGLTAIDAAVTLKADAIRFQRYDLREANLATNLAGGTLNVERLVGRLFDGDLDATAKVSAGSGNPVSGTVSLQNALVEQALQAVRGQADAKGRMSASGKFQASAASMRRLVNSLGGDGKISMTDVDVEKGVTGSTLTGLFGMVTAMNQLGGVLGNVGVREGTGLADASATFTAENGVITTRDAVVNSNFGKATSAGTVNLPAWTLDLQGQIALAPNVIARLFGKALDKEPVPFAITGSLNAPNYKVDTSKLAAGSIPVPGADKLLQKVPEGARGLVEGLLGGGGAKQQSAPEGGETQEQQAPPPQQQQKPPSPEDLIRGLLKRR